MPASPPVRSVFRCVKAVDCNDSDSSIAIRCPAAPSPVYEMMQGFMRLFDGAEGMNYFTFGPCRRPGAILACRCMRQAVNLQELHHILEYMAFDHRSIIDGTAFSGDPAGP